MVERPGRAKGKKKLMGNHQRCWLWGKHLVWETLLAGKWPILELYLAADLPEADMAVAQELSARHKLVLRTESREALGKRCHSSEHQGYVAKVAPFPFAAMQEVLAARPAAPLYLVLDAVQDPHNFGAMLRSAEVFAADAVFIGTHRQVPVTSLVARSSAGAVGRLPIVQVADLLTLAVALKVEHVTLVGASGKADTIASAHDFRRATAIVIGNEGAGISPELERVCDALVRIPQFGAISSLNAAAAAAVLFYEARSQRARDS